MSKAVSFLFDENVPPMFYIQLINMEPAIITFSIGDGIAPPKGTLDPEIFIWIEEKGCLLVTNNRASMPVHLRDHLNQGRQIPGIIQLPKRFNIKSILEDLRLIWVASIPGEFQNQIIHLPLS
jgi:hypothetical protein